MTVHIMIYWARGYCVMTAVFSCQVSYKEIRVYEQTNGLIAVKICTEQNSSTTIMLVLHQLKQAAIFQYY